METKMESEAMRSRALNMLINDVKPKDVAAELDISYPKVLKWLREYKEAKEDNAVISLLDIERSVVHDVVEEVVKPKLAMIDEELEEVVDKTVMRVDGLRLLDTELQFASTRLAKRIAAAANSEDLEARDILGLSDALSKLQIAFFAKGTSVNVLNQTNNMSDNSLSTFAKLMKD